MNENRHLALHRSQAIARLIAILLAVAWCALAITGCGNAAPSGSAAPSDTAAGSEAAAAAAPSDTAAGSEATVAAAPSDTAVPNRTAHADDAAASTDDAQWPEGAEVGTFEVDGGSIMYHLYGKDKPGTPLVFLHGGPGGDCTCFFKQVPLAEDRPVLLYDQLGCSGSDFSDVYQTADQVKPFMTVEHYVDEVQQVIQHFGFDEFVLVGHSWGSMLAVEYASAKQPAGLKGIVLAGPFLNTDQWIEDAERLIKSLPDGQQKWETVRACTESGVYTDEYEKINEEYARNFSNRTPDCKAGRPKEPDARVIDGCDPYSYMWGPTEFDCTGTLRGHDSTVLLKDITVPILYVSGRYDSGTPEAAQRYCSLTPNGSTYVIEDASHGHIMEKPDEFNDVVRNFVESVERDEAMAA